ncbi:hypothetical protein TNCV_4783151 [Trichonephila clavipes]|nr:hypothetical protein TNCV_4783151 [Trichonephila clavipes]
MTSNLFSFDRAEEECPRFSIKQDRHKTENKIICLVFQCWIFMGKTLKLNFKWKSQVWCKEYEKCINVCAPCKTYIDVGKLNGILEIPLKLQNEMSHTVIFIAFSD